MKRIIRYIISISIAAVLAVSCMVDSGKAPYPTGEETKALLLYGYTTDLVMSPMLDALDIALKLQEYIDAGAGTEAQRDSIEDLYFYDYKIRRDGDKYSIINFANVYTDGHGDINVPGAKWRVQLEENEYVINISCSAPGEWSLGTESELFIRALSWDRNKTLSVSRKYDGDIPMRFAGEFIYLVKGSGHYTQNDYDSGMAVTDVRFDIVSPLHVYLLAHAGDKSPGIGSFCYYSGEMQMDFSIGRKNGYSGSVKVCISGSPSDRVIDFVYEEKAVE